MDTTANSVARPHFLHVCLVLAVLAAGCTASRPHDAEHQYLDKATGITVNGLQKPAIFHHDDPRLAAHSRDYLYVGPVQMNRMGKYAYYLWLGEWSTIDRLSERKRVDNKGYSGKVLEGVVILLDGIPMELYENLDPNERSRIIQHPYETPVNNMRTAFMRVSRDQLNRIALANSVVVRVGDEPQARTYKLWSGTTGSFDSIVNDPAMANSEHLVKIK